MNSSRSDDKKSQVLRTLLIILFIYGGVSYSLSLIEYTWFQASGEALFGVEEHYESMTEEQLQQAFRECGTHLMGATGVATEDIGTPIVVRCGRFWPFYRYSLEVPALPQIPGALIRYDSEPPQITQSRTMLTGDVRLASYAWMALAVVVLGLSFVSLYHFAVRRDPERAFRWGFQAFLGSVLMLATYIGFSFWIDPMFRFGW